MTHQSRIRYDGELPSCCVRAPWRLPRPGGASYSLVSSSRDDGWDLGFDRWVVSVDATFFDLDRDLLKKAMAEHLEGAGDELDLDQCLRDHGVVFEAVDHGIDEVWAAEVTVLRAVLFSEWHQPAGRLSLQSGAGLLSAADSDSQELLELVEPLVDHDGGLWSRAVLDIDEDNEACSTFVALEDVVVTPALRGYGLGAWAAASALTQVVDASTLVAARAFPLDRHGAPLATGDDEVDVRGFDYLTGAEKLATYWSAALGLTRIPQFPDLLIYNTVMQNHALQKALSAYK